MTVLPCRSEPLCDPLALPHLFLQAHQAAVRTRSPQILSFSQILPTRLDLQSVLQTQLHKEQHYCYWENRQQRIAILALGQVAQTQIAAESRFTQAQWWLQHWQAQIHQGGALAEPHAGLHCFAAFTFFAQTQATDAIFAPATLFLPQVQMTTHAERTIWVMNVRVTADTSFEQVQAQMQAWDYHLTHHPRVLPYRRGGHSPSRLPACCTFPAFTAAVEQALRDIASQQFAKIVLAHTLEQTYTQPIHISHTLARLGQTHPDCYLFSFSTGNGYHFLGASPERLIRIRDRVLWTDALAGSAPRGTSPEQDRAIALQLCTSEKEQREHQAVSDYILQRLRELGLQPHQWPRQLRQLTNIQHLWTPIQAQLPSHLHPLQIVQQLHPTPAVAGMPTAIACAKIREYEAFERGLYAAPLGWIDLRGNSEFIVGIRSALVRDNWVRLYGGAGIVAGSDPERELAEVQLKLQAMLQALG